MNKEQLGKEVAQKQETTIKQGISNVEAVFETIAEAIASGEEEIYIYGFGKFSVVSTAPRKGRNPQTGEEISVPAGKKLKFKAAKQLSDSL